MSRDEYARQFFKTRMCRFNANSRCTKGDECSHAHSRDELMTRPNFRKTSLCRHWTSGTPCEKGAKCHYAHGEKELRSRILAPEAVTSGEPSGEPESSEELNTQGTAELNSKAECDLPLRVPTRSSTSEAVMPDASPNTRVLYDGRAEGAPRWPPGPSWFCYDGMYVAPAYQFSHMRRRRRDDEEQTPRCAYQD